MPHFDFTISVSDLVLFGGGVFAFLKVLLLVRDGLRDLARSVGTTNPPSGLLGDMLEVKGDIRQQREWLIRAGVGDAGWDGRERRRRP